MDESKEKEVLYFKYCRYCSFKNVAEDEDPCHDCLNQPWNADSHKPIHYQQAYNAHPEKDILGYYKTIKKIKDYVYEVWYDEIDYYNASLYFSKLKDFQNYGCSSIVSGNWYGRNLDWFYNNQCEFIVHIPKINNRHASIGIAGGISKLTNDFVMSKEYSDLYKIIPFQMQDGINDCGVFANMNVVPTDKGKNKKSIPTKGTAKLLSSLMLIRFILDHFESAHEAVNYIKDKVSIYFPKALHDMDYEVHYMIGDANDVYVLEIVDRHVVILEHNIMTNFYLDGVVPNEDNTVYTPETQFDRAFLVDEPERYLVTNTIDNTYIISKGFYKENAMNTNHITQYGSGLERYNIMVEANVTSKNDMRALMNSLTYTKSYLPDTDPYWYTEFAGTRGLTVASEVEEYLPVVEIAQHMYQTRTREGSDTWQTTHSSVYDIENKDLYVIFQEDGEELKYSI